MGIIPFQRPAWPAFEPPDPAFEPPDPLVDEVRSFFRRVG
jgi:hypothetical protein